MSEQALIPQKKDYELILFKAKLKSSDAKADHPLKKRRAGQQAQDDGLTMKTEQAERKDSSLTDSTAAESTKSDALQEYIEREKTAFEPTTWEQRKVEIMQRFKKDFGGMEIFMNEGGDRDLDRPIRLGRGRSRMDQLQKKSRSQKIASITADEFEIQFQRLKNNMLQFWKGGDKVACLKIAIQCAKLLNDVETPMFYPHKFMIMIDILDAFGNLVFDRLKELSLTAQGIENWEAVLDQDINFRNTPEDVKEKDFNWHLKIACIREVLPRIYLELALVNCKRFMNRRLNTSDLDRLGYMVRGVAEPLSASYVSAYLARVGNELDAGAKDYLYNIIQCMYKHWEYAAEYGHPNVKPEKYFKLFEPSIDWIFYCAGQNSTEKHFKQIIKLYNANQKKMIFLRAIIDYYPPTYIQKYAEDMLAEIKQFELDDRLQLVKSLGIALIRSKPRRAALKLQFLNFSWEQLAVTQNASTFMDVSAVLVEFAIKNMKQQSVNNFISEIFKRFRDFVKVGEDEEMYQKLEHLIIKVMLTAKNFSELIGLDNFMSLLNYFSANIKFRLCEVMLDYFSQQEDTFNDEYKLHTVLAIAKQLHDKIDSLSDKSIAGRISTKLCFIIQRIDFGRDLEKQLKTYTEARGMFGNLDEVTETLINVTLNLAMKAHKFRRAKHDKKTLGFVKACVAYCHITIPSLNSNKHQTSLFLSTSRVALANGLISETDSIIKATLLCLNSQFKQTENYEQDAILTGHLLNIIGHLIVIPSDPEKHFFQTSMQIQNLIKKKQWQPGTVFLQIRLYCALIQYLAAQTQDKLPYSCPRVDSNDMIFLGDEEFAGEAERLIQEIFDQIVEIVADAMDDPDPQNQASVSQSMTLLASTMIATIKLTPFVEQYISKMLKRAQKSWAKCQSHISNAFFEKTKKYCSAKIEKHKFMLQTTGE